MKNEKPRRDEAAGHSEALRRRTEALSKNTAKMQALAVAVGPQA